MSYLISFNGFIKTRIASFILLKNGVSLFIYTSVNENGTFFKYFSKLIERHRNLHLFPFHPQVDKTPFRKVVSPGFRTG